MYFIRPTTVNNNIHFGGAVVVDLLIDKIASTTENGIENDDEAYFLFLFHFFFSFIFSCFPFSFYYIYICIRNESISWIHSSIDWTSERWNRNESTTWEDRKKKTKNSLTHACIVTIDRKWWSNDDWYWLPFAMRNSIVFYSFLCSLYVCLG